jgi:hypothetical protein
MAYYALHKLHILPHELLSLSSNEQAFIYAAIQIRVEKEEKAIRKVKDR